MYNELKEKLFNNIEKYQSDVFSLNEFLANNPEISGEEYQSSQKIVNLLEKNGYEVEYPLCNISTAFRAIDKEVQYNNKIGLMLEYDALPEIGHACGHCVSGSIGVLAGLALKDLQDELKSEIHIIGTPYEETEGGKVDLVNKGIFNDYDMAMMIHLYDKNIVRPTALALDSFLYTFRGKASHASSAPWSGRNAFNGVQLMFHAIDMWRQHVRSDVRMHGIIRNPGESPNIVPEECSAEIYLRAEERSYLNEIVEIVDKCAEGAALATGTTWKKEYTANSFDNLQENSIGEAVLKSVYEELGLIVDSGEDDLFGSTDAGNVSQICPTFHSTLQLVPKGVAIHSEEFAKHVQGRDAEKAIINGAKITGLQIIKIFSDDEVLEKMREDFYSVDKK